MNGEWLAGVVAEAQPILDALVRHPFVQEVAGGTLERDRFHFWVQQDYLFVREALKARGLAIARAPDEPIRRALIENAGALRREMDLFEDYAREVGVRIDVQPTPLCLGYAAFRQSAAVLATFPEFLAGTWAGERAYYDTWAAAKTTAGTGQYRRWIENWTSPGFAAWVDWLERTLAELLNGAPPRELDRVREAIFTTLRFEYLFWDMVYHRQDWPV